MALTRKTRVSGTSIVVTIPSQIVEAFDISSGDFFEIIPVRNGEIRLRKIKIDHPYEDKELKRKIQKRTN